MPAAQRNSSDPTILEFATETNTHPNFIRKRIRNGDLEAYRLRGSKLIRIRRESADAFKVPIGGAV